MIELRTITIDFASQTIVSSYLLGKIGEHNATKLSITPPTSLSGDARTSIYRVSFGTGGKSFLSESFTTVPFTIDLWKQLTECPRMSIQIIAYDSDGEYVGKSDKLTGFYFESSINGIEVEVDGENHDIANEILKVKSDLASEVARAEAAESGKVDKVSGKGLSTNDYTDAEKNKLASLTNNNPFYGTCSTSESTADKVVTVDSTFALQNGVMVIVKFSNDCYKPTVGNVTLNVNGTGARTIVCGALSPNIVKIPATTTVAFVLSGNYWIQLGYYKATDTSPGFVKLSDAIDSDFGVLYQTAATPKAVYDLNQAKLDKSLVKSTPSAQNKVVTETELAEKSTVSVSASGTATEEISYITIDGAEKKIAGGSVDSVNGQTGTVVLDGDDIAYDNNLSINDKLDAKYEKPSGGIPASDIASGVIPTVPSNVSAFTNDSGYLTQHQDITGKQNVSISPISGMSANTVEGALSELNSDIVNKVNKIQYSTTEEIDTGNKWLNGETIWQKTFVITSATSGEYAIITHDLGINTVISVNKVMKLCGSDNVVYYNSGSYNGPVSYVGCAITETLLGFSFYFTANFVEGYITIQYTKTTD